MELPFEYVPIFKALGDETRLKIIRILICGELCESDILELFDITQPTLSYHMKILTECGLVKRKKDGSRIRYSNNYKSISEIKKFSELITIEQEKCISMNYKKDKKCE